MKTKSREGRGSSVFPLYGRRILVQEGTYICAASRFPSNTLTSLQKLCKDAEPLATQALRGTFPVDTCFCLLRGGAQ